MSNHITDLKLSHEDTVAISIITSQEVKNASFILLMRTLMGRPTSAMNDKECRSVLASCQAYGSMIDFVRVAGVTPPPDSGGEDDEVPEEEVPE